MLVDSLTEAARRASYVVSVELLIARHRMVYEGGEEAARAWSSRRRAVEEASGVLSGAIMGVAEGVRYTGPSPADLRSRAAETDAELASCSDAQRRFALTRERLQLRRSISDAEREIVRSASVPMTDVPVDARLYAALKTLRASVRGYDDPGECEACGYGPDLRWYD